MTPDRKKLGVAFWVTVVLVIVLVVYPLSAGPAEFWLSSKLRNITWMTTTIYTAYAPFWWAFAHSPDCFRKAIGPYFDWWALDVELPPR